MPESSLGLQRTVAESDDPKEERVLIISDCKPMRGITPNEYADIAAAAHAQCQVESTDSIIAAVTSRDCRRGFCRRDAAQLRGGRRGDGCGGGDCEGEQARQR
jgi:hypothetical protein